MAGKNKQRGSRRRRKDKQKRSQAARHADRWLRLPELAFPPPHPERLGPALHIAPDGTVVDDPWQVLGLPEGTLDEEQIRAAYRRGLVENPPEHAPERAQALRAAMDRLLEPDQAVTRVLGQVRAPDPDAWGLPPADLSLGDGLVGRPARLLAQAVLYALLEDQLMPKQEASPTVKATQLDLF